jgi:hypothetical protein
LMEVGSETSSWRYTTRSGGKPAPWAMSSAAGFPSDSDDQWELLFQPTDAI